MLLTGDLDAHYNDTANQKAHAEQQGHLTARVQESHQAVHEGATHLEKIVGALTEHRKNIGIHTQIDIAVKTITKHHETIQNALEAHATALNNHQKNGTFMSKKDVKKHADTVKNTIKAIRTENKVMDIHGDLTTKEHAQRMEAQLDHMQATIEREEEEAEKAADHAAAMAAKQHP